MASADRPERPRRRKAAWLTSRIRFAALPPIGLALVVNGQRHDLLSIDTHERLDGRETHLATWASSCATCGQPYTARSPALRFPEVRRCPGHRMPGRKVQREDSDAL